MCCLSSRALPSPVYSIAFSDLLLERWGACLWMVQTKFPFTSRKQAARRERSGYFFSLSPTVLADFSYYISYKVDFLHSARSHWKFYFLPLTFYTKAHVVNYLKELVAQLCLTLQSQGVRPVRSLCPWAFPGKNTGVGCHFLLQVIFLTQRLNLGLLHCRQIFYHLSHQGRKEDYLRR